MDSKILCDIVTEIAQRVIRNAELLTSLDQAIGDGDHGLNMRRGFQAVLLDIDTLSADGSAEFLRRVGTILVMKIGGASGPLYGTLFMSLGKAWPDRVDRSSLGSCLQAGVEAVAARGKSVAGQKTMLDVLHPVIDSFRQGDDIAKLRKVAADSAQATVMMEAKRGRASFLRERSVGHMDPGAQSSLLMIEAVCDVLERSK